MRRRSFIASCAAGAVAATVARADSSSQAVDGAADDRAVGALVAAKRLQVSGNFEQLRTAYHSDAMVVVPESLTPSLGRAEIVSELRNSSQTRKLLYFYYRQPQVMQFGNSAIVVSNYESGHSIDGKTVEATGKTSNVVLLGPDPPVIAMEMVVPNLRAGSYGALGTALAGPQLGVFPFRALGPAATTGAQTAGGGENDVLYQEVLGINNAWVAGDASTLLQYANPSGLVLMGDYSPYFISGSEAIKQHFADFYKTSKVNMIRALEPAVRIWGAVAAVEFTFNLDYDLDGKNRRSPGRAVYTFAQGGAVSSSSGRFRSPPSASKVAYTKVLSTATPNRWAIAACATSHLVSADIGDPYPSLG